MLIKFATSTKFFFSSYTKFKSFENVSLKAIENAGVKTVNNNNSKNFIQNLIPLTDDYIKEHAIVIAETRMIEGRERDIDSYGYIVYKGEEARYMLATIMNEVNELIEMLHKKEITKEAAENRIDALLFEGYNMSMLSDGFRDFYVTKHSKIDQI